MSKAGLMVCLVLVSAIAAVPAQRGGGFHAGRGFSGGGFRGRSGFHRGYYGFGWSYPYSYGLGFGWDYPSYAPYPVYEPQSYVYVPTSYMPPAGPVIVNQTFQAPVREQQEPPPPGRVTSPASYYLIAFPDGSVQIAVAYWVENGTLHYVTRDKAQKEAAISSIDRQMTEQLNRDRHIDFRLP